MSSVRDNILKIIQRVDPNLADGGVEITTANIATWRSSGSDAFTAQRVVDCYNDARKTLAQVLLSKSSVPDRYSAFSALIHKDDEFEFSEGKAQKSDLPGYMETVSLHTSAGAPIIVLPGALYKSMKRLDSAYNPLVFEYNEEFEVANSSNVPDAATYVIRYFGIVDWSMAEAIDASTAEVFNSVLDPVLIELACALMSEQGATTINALAIKLTGGKEA